jgi:Protein of unknown function (DUF2637)
VTGAERAIRWSTVLAVTGVAVVAGWVSYVHAYRVVSAHGETGVLAGLYPGTVDGLIYAASMVLLDAARRAVPAPPLARWLLAAGIGATLVANVWSGLAYGPPGALVASWPALALVGSYELLMLLVRRQAQARTSPVAGRSRQARPRARAQARSRGTAPVTPEHAEVHFAPLLAAGTVPSLRQVRAQLHVGTDRARQLRDHLASLNGKSDT